MPSMSDCLTSTLQVCVLENHSGGGILSGKSTATAYSKMNKAKWGRLLRCSVFFFSFKAPFCCPGGPAAWSSGQRPSNSVSFLKRVKRVKLRKENNTWNCQRQEVKSKGMGKWEQRRQGPASNPGPAESRLHRLSQECAAKPFPDSALKWLPL